MKIRLNSTLNRTRIRQKISHQRKTRFEQDKIISVDSQPDWNMKFLFEFNQKLDANPIKKPHQTATQSQYNIFMYFHTQPDPNLKILFWSQPEPHTKKSSICNLIPILQKTIETKQNIFCWYVPFPYPTHINLNQKCQNRNTSWKEIISYFNAIMKSIQQLHNTKFNFYFEKWTYLFFLYLNIVKFMNSRKLCIGLTTNGIFRYGSDIVSTEIIWLCWDRNQQNFPYFFFISTSNINFHVRVGFR